MHPKNVSYMNYVKTKQFRYVIVSRKFPFYNSEKQGLIPSIVSCFVLIWSHSAL